MAKHAPTHRCPYCGYDLSYWLPAKDYLCPECGGRCLRAEAREAANPRRLVPTFLDVLVHLVLGPPILAAGVFALGLLLISVLQSMSIIVAIPLALLPTLTLMAYAVAMAWRLWPRVDLARSGQTRVTVLRVSIVLSLLFNLAIMLVVGYLFLMLASISVMGN